MFTAADEFDERLKRLDEIVSLDIRCDNANGITDPTQVMLVEGLRASLVVLPVGFFEEFLRSLIRQYIDAINNKMPRLSWASLPEKLRKAHVIDTPLAIRQKRLTSEDYNAFEMRMLNDIQTAFYRVLSPKIMPQTYIVSVESFTNTNSNPNSDTVKELFNRLEIHDVLRSSDVTTIMRTFDPAYTHGDAIILKLDAIVEARHTVAHGRILSGFSRSDLQYNLRFLRELSRSLESAASTESSNLLK